jgi:hypothetical protein
VDLPALAVNLSSLAIIKWAVLPAWKPSWQDVENEKVNIRINSYLHF